VSTISHPGLFPLTIEPTVIASTAVSVSGVYFINATLDVAVDSRDNLVNCFVKPESTSQDQVHFSRFWVVQGTVNVADVWTVSSGDTIEVSCSAGGDSGNSLAGDALVTATLIANAATQAPGQKPDTQRQSNPR
jgi:hypothetical protein